MSVEKPYWRVARGDLTTGPMLAFMLSRWLRSIPLVGVHAPDGRADLGNGGVRRTRHRRLRVVVLKDFGEARCIVGQLNQSRPGRGIVPAASVGSISVNRQALRGSDRRNTLKESRPIWPPTGLLLVATSSRSLHILSYRGCRYRRAFAQAARRLIPPAAAHWGGVLRRHVDPIGRPWIDPQRHHRQGRHSV